MCDLNRFPENSGAVGDKVIRLDAVVTRPNVCRVYSHTFHIVCRRRAVGQVEIGPFKKCRDQLVFQDEQRTAWPFRAPSRMSRKPAFYDAV